MKFFPVLLAAGLLSFSAASAQTTPGTTTPSVPGQSGSAAPSATPSGMAAPAADPRGNVSAGEVFTKGDPNGNRMRDKNMGKRKKMKGDMSEGSGKMKSKM